MEQIEYEMGVAGNGDDHATLRQVWRKVRWTWKGKGKGKGKGEGEGGC